MPNGDYSLSPEDWAEIKAFFRELSPILCSFAAAHNLAIDEYYHDVPAWTFRFRHPEGGGAGIQLMRVNESTIRISTMWYIDEYETFTHYTKSAAGSDVLWRAINLREILEQSLREIASWNKGSLTPHPGYEKFWSRYTKEEWQQMSSTERLPQPKL
jgi:hypothetical protein